LETIKINLATFEYQDKRLSYPVILVVSVIVLMVSSLSIKAGLNRQTEIKEYEKIISEREQSTLKKQQIEKIPRLKDAEIESVKNDANFIGGIINQHAYPYDRLFDALEASVPNGVVISSFGMSKDFNKVILDGKADSMNNITLFLNNLNVSKIYKNSNLLSLSVSRENNAEERSVSVGNGITFEVESATAKDQIWQR
jgi:Tfp pilus assembly protein PilN